MQLFRHQLLLADFSDVHPPKASISLIGEVAFDETALSACAL